MLFAAMPESLILIGIILLWLLLLFLLLRGSYRAYRRGKGKEATMLVVVALAIVMFTGQYILFFAWAAGCEVGLPLSCMT